MEKAKEDNRQILKEFTIWVAAKYGMPISEKLIEAEIEAFYKYRESLKGKNVEKQHEKKKSSKNDYSWHYHG